MLRRVLLGIAITLGVLLLGGAGFVWWALQPRPNPQPLPDALIALDAPEGRRLLQDADALADHAALTTAYQPQELASYCGVASGVIALNATGADLTQSSFFTDDTYAVRSQLQVTFGGMALDELAGLLAAHGRDVTLQHADAITVEEFRAALARNLSTEGDVLVVNYQREVLGQGRMGHISPVAAYDRDSDRALILDTASHKYPPTWVPVELLLSAMQTTDSSSGRSRGFLEVR